MTQQADIAVIGAAGPTGRITIGTLLAAGMKVRALVHREQQAELFPDSVDCRAVALEDQASLAKAMQDAAAVHYIPPLYNASEEQFIQHVIGAMQSAGIKRLTYHSVLHAHTPDMPHHHRKSLVELAIRETDLDWTIIQPAMYMQSPLRAYLNEARDTLSPGFDVTKPFNPVDAFDLGAVVAKLHSSDTHRYATYELAGTETLTIEDMARIIGDVLGHTVTARQAESATIEANAKNIGLSGTRLEEFMLMQAHYNSHGLLGNGNVLRMLLGREPTSFEAVVTRTLV